MVVNIANLNEQNKTYYVRIWYTYVLYVMSSVIRASSKWMVSYATPTLVLVTWLLS